MSTPSPPRNVKPPKRYVGLKPHRRRSSDPLPAVLFFSPSLCILYPIPLPSPPPPASPPAFLPRFVYAIHGDADAGTALTALMHSANIASAVARTGLYLHYGFFLSCACVRACVVCMLCAVKTRRRRRKSRCRALAESTRLYLCRKPSNLMFYDFGLSLGALGTFISASFKITFKLPTNY